MSAKKKGAQKFASADALIETIYQNLKAFEKEAITAGREFSRHRMNQCISVSIYGVSVMNELKTLALFAVFVYVALILYRISKKFAKKA